MIQILHQQSRQPSHLPSPHFHIDEVHSEISAADQLLRLEPPEFTWLWCVQSCLLWEESWVHVHRQPPISLTKTDAPNCGVQYTTWRPAYRGLRLGRASSNLAFSASRCLNHTRYVFFCLAGRSVNQEAQSYWGSASSLSRVDRPWTPKPKHILHYKLQDPNIPTHKLISLCSINTLNFNTETRKTLKLPKRSTSQPQLRTCTVLTLGNEPSKPSPELLEGSWVVINGILHIFV